MAERVTLALPEPLIQQARAIATFTDQRMEDVLVEWLNRAMNDWKIKSLLGNQVLAQSH
jgi:hypothetical protein